MYLDVIKVGRHCLTPSGSQNQYINYLLINEGHKGDWGKAAPKSYYIHFYLF